MSRESPVNGKWIAAALLVSSTVVLTPSKASADWQYTKWGMTAEQALKASKGALHPCGPGDCVKQVTDVEVAKLHGRYVSGEFEFQAHVFFDKIAGKLTMVNLRLLNPHQFPLLVNALRNRYGAPVDSSQNRYLDLNVWRTATDQISVSAIGSMVTLTYAARITNNNKGL
jgi:hypothetical protein